MYELLAKILSINVFKLYTINHIYKLYTNYFDYFKHFIKTQKLKKNHF